MSRCRDIAIRNYPRLAACRQVRFDVTGNSAIRTADPENPTLEPNMKCIGTRCRDMAIRVSWGHMELPFGGRKVVGVSDGTIRKSDGGFL